MRLNFAFCPRIAAAALAMLSLAGCAAHINLVLDPTSGEVLLNPQKGQTILWRNGGTGFAQFLLVSPCLGGQLNANPCVVTQTKGLYVYQCAAASPCQDPEVVVGSAVGMMQLHPKFTATTAIAVEVAIACVNNKIALQPDPIPTSGNGFTAGQSVKWAAVGPSPLTNWSTNLDICTSQVNQGQPVCTIKTGTSGTHTYQVTADNCGSNTGTITVQ